MAPLSSRHSTGERLPFCEAEDHSDRVFIRSLLQCIATLRATDTADKACFVQNGDDLLQIFIGDLLALRHILQADRFSCMICSKINISLSAYLPLCKKSSCNIYLQYFQYSSDL